MSSKQKTVFAYFNGEYLLDVVKMALAENIMLSDAKKKLTSENPPGTITFKVVEGHTD